MRWRTERILRSRRRVAVRDGWRLRNRRRRRLGRRNRCLGRRGGCIASRRRRCSRRLRLVGRRRRIVLDGLLHPSPLFLAVRSSRLGRRVCLSPLRLGCRARLLLLAGRRRRNRHCRTLCR